MKRSECEKSGKVTKNVTLRSAVERVAEEMFSRWAPGADHDGYIGDGWLRLARWHLREARKARGRTVGWVCVDEAGLLCCGGLHSRCDAEGHAANGGYEVARVVLDPKPRKGAKR